MKSDNNINRQHEAAYFAVHKENHTIFGGNKSGTGLGYPKVGFLRSAMTNARLNHEDYEIHKLTINPYGMPNIVTVQ